MQGSCLGTLGFALGLTFIYHEPRYDFTYIEVCLGETRFDNVMLVMLLRS
jgi:hypothetical protein